MFVESNDPLGPFGSKGVGEPGLVPVPAALANAIYDAVGVHITDFAITREKILRELNAKRAR